MHISKSEWLGVAVCFGALASMPNTVVKNSPVAMTTVKADTSYVEDKSYGVDVSSFQGTDMSNYAQNGAKYAFVKTTEGTWYTNPKASGQVSSALANNMMTMSYHFAVFGNDAQKASAEANYAVNASRNVGVPAGSYVVCDWEAGDGNNINGPVEANTDAILSFMDTVNANGYKPMLYSGAYLMRNKIDTDRVVAKYPNSLWVASYATMGRIDEPDFEYFPSMNGVAIWQFTHNWRGLHVDGNINVLPLSKGGVSQAPSSVPATPSVDINQVIASASQIVAQKEQPAITSTTTDTNQDVPFTAVGRVNYVPGYGIMLWGQPGYKNALNRYLPHGSRWKIFKKRYINGSVYYNLGGSQWVDGKYIIIE